MTWAEYWDGLPARLVDAIIQAASEDDSGAVSPQTEIEYLKTYDRIATRLHKP